MRKLLPSPEKKMVKNDSFCHSSPNTQISVPFSEPKDRSNSMKGRSREGEGHKSTEGGRIWYGRQ